MLRRAHLALALPLSLLCSAGCPQQVTPDSLDKKAAAPDPVKPDDPRVVADSGDLYPAKSAPPSEPEAAPGSGSSDETNGVCRLFSPKQPEPVCCPEDLGFDITKIQKHCGEFVYLGESMYGTCGYHFMDPKTEKRRWFRLSAEEHPSAAEAAASHDQLVSTRVARDPNFKSTPVPGVPGAMWSTYNGIHWAFFPGWPQVRKLTWRDGFCSDEGIVEVIKALVATPPIAAKAPRKSLVPGVPDAKPEGEAEKAQPSG